MANQLTHLQFLFCRREAVEMDLLRSSRISLENDSVGPHFDAARWLNSRPQVVLVCDLALQLQYGLNLRLDIKTVLTEDL